MNINAEINSALMPKISIRPPLWPGLWPAPARTSASGQNHISPFQRLDADFRLCGRAGDGGARRHVTPVSHPGDIGVARGGERSASRVLPGLTPPVPCRRGFLFQVLAVVLAIATPRSAQDLYHEMGAIGDTLMRIGDWCPGFESASCHARQLS